MKRKIWALCLIAVLAVSVAAFAACGEDPTPDPTPEAELTGLTVSGTFKTRYMTGDTFSADGMVVTATYDDGTTKTLTADDYTLTAPTGGLKSTDTKITVKAGSKTVNRKITVGTSSNVKTEDAIKNEFKANKKSHTFSGTTINYCLREPDDKTAPAPLVLFLHGAGERGNDNEAQLKNALAKAYTRFDSMFYDSYVIAPQCPYRETDNGEDVNDGSQMNINYTKWVNTLWTAGSYKASEVAESVRLKTVADLVKTFAAKPEVDASRVYVVGLSMGGYGTWDILARHNDLFAAGVPICGGGPTDKADVLADLPIYAFHGTADTAVPYEAGSKTMYDAISAKGKGKMIFHTFEGAGHGIWDQALTYAGSATEPATLDWLFAQSK